MNVLVAIPTLGRPEISSILSALRAAQTFSRDTGYDAHVEWIAGCNITVARNKYAAMALDDSRGFTHVMFIDDDTVVPPDSITKLSVLDTDIATGVTPFLYKGTPKVNVATGDTWLDPWPEGVFEIEAAGTSCMLVNVDVFRRMGFPWFNYYQTEVGDYTTEDTPFVRRAREEVNATVICDASVRCGHYKIVNLEQMFDIVATPAGVTAP